MSRRMSCSITVDAVRERRKTVTRRHVDTWTTLKAGDRLTLIEKGMGLPKGTKQVVLAEVEVVDVRLVQLYGISDDEIEREGFEMDHTDFVDMWLDSHRVPPFLTQTEAMEYQVRRIEWRYIDEVTP